MKNILKILYYIDHPEIAILEVQDPETEDNILWVIYYKSTARVRRFAFSSLPKTQASKGNRDAKKGILKKVEDLRRFWVEIDDQLFAFRQKKPDLLPKAMIDSIDRQLLLLF